KPRRLPRRRRASAIRPFDRHARAIRRRRIRRHPAGHARNRREARRTAFVRSACRRRRQAVAFDQYRRRDLSIVAARPPERLGRHPVVLGALFFVYVVTGKLGLLLALVNPSATAVWA